MSSLDAGLGCCAGSGKVQSDGALVLSGSVAPVTLLGVQPFRDTEPQLLPSGSVGPGAVHGFSFFLF